MTTWMLDRRGHSASGSRPVPLLSLIGHDVLKVCEKRLNVYVTDLMSVLNLRIKQDFLSSE